MRDSLQIIDQRSGFIAICDAGVADWRDLSDFAVTKPGASIGHTLNCPGNRHLPVLSLLVDGGIQIKDDYSCGF